FVAVGGELLQCSIRGRFFEEDRASPVVVGDRVLVQVGPTEGVIEAVLPRTSRIAKPSGRDGRTQIVAANVDLLVIVASLASPALRPGVIDRFLVIAEREAIAPLVVINKLDLDAAAQANTMAERYRRLGYDVLLTSIVTQAGVSDLRARLEGHTSLFVGHSGVGKSSLLNRVDDRLRLRVAEVSSKHGKGKHTTTSVQLLGLGNDTYVVDSPGVREIQVPDMPQSSELGFCFPEIRALAPQCRYPNCTHSHEPSCAVKQAAEAGAIERERFASYLRILAGDGRQPRHDSF
ncbi:MAG: ribosome small subunit-dependent GTPase A, partial [Planctomycetota bacterium]